MRLRHPLRTILFFRARRGKKVHRLALFNFFSRTGWHCSIYLQQTFQQISDTKSCGYVRDLVRFGVNKISFEGGERWFFLFDRILVFGLNKKSKVKFSPTFNHLQRKSSCHMEFLAIFSLAILGGK